MRLTGNESLFLSTPNEVPDGVIALLVLKLFNDFQRPLDFSAVWESCNYIRMASYPLFGWRFALVRFLEAWYYFLIEFLSVLFFPGRSFLSL